MNDERPTHGGAANMPPFPRASNTESERPVEPATTTPSEADLPGEDVTADEEASLPPASDAAELAGDRPDDADDDEILDFDDVPVDRLEAAPDEDTEELEDVFGDDDEEGDDDIDEPGSFRSTVTAEIGRRAELSLLKGMESVADTLDETAHRIGRLAQLRGGPDALSPGPVHSTVGWLEGAADYLRTSDLEAVRSDLRQRVRARPVQSLGIALCTGWLLGRILR